jgi:hypothetical protein
MLSSLLPPSVREAAYRRKFLENREENLFMGSFLLKHHTWCW